VFRSNIVFFITEDTSENKLEKKSNQYSLINKTRYKRCIHVSKRIRCLLHTRSREGYYCRYCNL